MRFTSRIGYAVTAVANAAALVAIAVITAVGSSMSSAQRYNSAAAVWKGDSKESFTQVSCFFGDIGGLTTDTVTGVEAGLRSSLKNAGMAETEERRLIASAYSAPVGSYSVSCDTLGRSDAELIAVGGDFFLFRQFDLLGGSYFQDSDLMQDGAVLERTLAFALYGSDDIAGMSIYINDRQFYIAGVVNDPLTKEEQRCAGDTPRAYISYDSASELTGSENGFKDIACYECILPDPVSGFGYSMVKDYFIGGNVSVVNNSARFDPSVRAKRYKKLSDYAIRSDNIAYPYWENASRIVEFKLTRMYFARRLLMVIPAVTLVWLVVLGLRALKRGKLRLAGSVSLKASRLRWNIIQKMEKIKEKLKRKS